LGAVDTVSVTVCELTPLSVTLVGLNVQRAPAGRPPYNFGSCTREEVAEFVKLTVSVDPFTGAMVNVAVADCPAETEPGARLLATESVKSATVTEAGVGDVEGLSRCLPRRWR